MTTYSSWGELNGETLTLGDKVIFRVKGRELRGQIHSYFIEFEEVINNIVFLLCDMTDKQGQDFLSEAYGYEQTGGGWPQCRTNDYEALTRGVLATFKLLNQGYQTTNWRGEFQ